MYSGGHKGDYWGYLSPPQNPGVKYHPLEF